MKRTAILAILIALTASSVPSAAPRPKDPEPFFVAFTSDGGRIVVAMRWGGVKVLSVPDLKEVRSFAVENDRPLTSVAVSPSGRWLATDQDGKELRIWNLETGQAQFTASTGWASPVYLFGPDDTFIVFQKGTLQAWDVKAAQKGRVVDASHVQRMAVSPDGRYLVVGGMMGGTCLVGKSSRDICLYAIDEMKVVAGTVWAELFPKEGFNGLGAKLADVAFTSDGRIMLTIGREVGGDYRTRYLAPDDLQVLEMKETVVPYVSRRLSGIRSAPLEQVEAVSADGQWKATASAYQKRLFLYRQVPHGIVLEKFASLP
jgi:WD40 repeat protein